MERTTCLIAGGGPAGMILGLLLARGGVQVIVLEKHGDFLRDFRGDTVHASTIRLLDELGLGDRFRALPQSRLGDFQLPDRAGRLVRLGDFSTLKPPYDYVAMVPQWDLLNLLLEAARDEPAFSLRMNTAATDLIVEDGRVVGVRTAGSGDPRGGDPRGGAEGDDDHRRTQGEIRADLVVACDGRNSVLRDAAGLRPRSFPVSFDTWWFRLSRTETEQGETGNLEPRFSDQEILLSFTRPTHHQVAYFTHKGDDARLRAEGVGRFRQRVAALRPDFADRVGEIGSTDDLNLLQVKVNRLSRWWRPGLLCIGDAAHAMSPVGGVGINLAVQDAVATAARLRKPLLAGRSTVRAVRAVQRRRMIPTVLMQSAQRVLQQMVFLPTLSGRRPAVTMLGPWLARWIPAIRRIPARGVAFGPLPEHAPGFARRPMLAVDSPSRSTASSAADEPEPNLDSLAQQS